MSLGHERVSQLEAWLLSAPHVSDGGESFWRTFAGKLRDCGVPIRRANVCLLTLHPELFGRTVQWHEAEGIKVLERQHELLEAPFAKVPVAELRKGVAQIRVPLIDGPLPFAVCEELRAQGCTEYVAHALPFSNGAISYASWATRAPSGFTDEARTLLDQLSTTLARRVELESAYYAAGSLLDVYLGKNAARRVLAGAFRRGGGELIDAAIALCDLRDFTKMSDQAPPAEIVEMLDAYFDRVVTAITARGGEVLKFIGDAVLAIFPVTAACSAQLACRNALGAAQNALAALDDLSRDRVREGKDALRLGFGLHLGRVMYGNIGSRDRLDFTVISSSVNETCRLESLCAVLGSPIAISEAFVTAAALEGVVDLGAHALKGVAEPVRVFSVEGLHYPASRRAES